MKKKSKYNVVNVRIEEEFLRKSFGCDIVAYYITPPEDSGGQATIEYLDKAAFRARARVVAMPLPARRLTAMFWSARAGDFLYNREKTGNGVLQRFVPPKGTNNSACTPRRRHARSPLAPNRCCARAATIRAVWSPKVCLMERRVNLRRLYGRRYSLYERAVTYEGTELDSSTGGLRLRSHPDPLLYADLCPFSAAAAPVKGTILPAEVQRLCETVVQHVAEVSFQKYQISRMVLYFRVDANDRVWLLYCSSMRLAGGRSGGGRRGSTASGPLAIEDTMALPPNVTVRPPSALGVHVRAQPRALGRAGTTGPTNMGDSSAEGNSAKQPPRALRPGAQSGALFRCPSCGATVAADTAHAVPFQAVLGHWEQALEAFASSDEHAEQWPPTQEMCDALLGVGMGPAREELGGWDPAVPPTLRAYHPRMEGEELAKMRTDPLFLYKQVRGGRRGG